MQLGHEVTVVSPYRRNPIQDSFVQYYGVSAEVKHVTLGHFDTINRWWLPSPINLWLLNWLFSRHLRTFLQTHEADMLYTRSPALLRTLLSAARLVIVELHQLPRWRLLFLRQLRRCHKVVCLTSAMRDRLLQCHIPAEQIQVEGDAVDLVEFTKTVDIATRLPAVSRPDTKRMIVGYVGRLKTLGMDKGVHDLLLALKILQSSQAFFGYIVGGPLADQKMYEAEAHALGLSDSDVLFTGEIPAAAVPQALSVCDIVAMPWPDTPHYRQNMSPLKMFEYMAASKPIITSDLPTIRDVLSEQTAFFCRSGDPASIAEVLQYIYSHPAEALERSRAARLLVERHTWEARMQRIVSHAQLSS